MSMAQKKERLDYPSFDNQLNLMITTDPRKLILSSPSLIHPIITSFS